MTTTIDATGQEFEGTYGLLINVADTTLLNGLFHRDLDPDNTPWSTWHDTCGVVTRNARPTICRSKFDNVGDGISFSAQGLRRSPDWTVCGVEMTRVHDDAIENDTMQAGVIYDSLFDGVFVFLSTIYGSSGTPPDGSANVVHIQDTLVRVASYHTSYKPTKYGYDKHGPFFKCSLNPLNGIPPSFTLQGVTLACDSDSPYGDMIPPPRCTATGTTLIWLGDPAAAYKNVWVNAWRAVDPSLKVLDGMAAWESRADAWRAAHV